MASGTYWKLVSNICCRKDESSLAFNDLSFVASKDETKSAKDGGNRLSMVSVWVGVVGSSFELSVKPELGPETPAYKN